MLLLQLSKIFNQSNEKTIRNLNFSQILKIQRKIKLINSLSCEIKIFRKFAQKSWKWNNKLDYILSRVNVLLLIGAPSSLIISNSSEFEFWLLSSSEFELKLETFKQFRVEFEFSKTTSNRSIFCIYKKFLKANLLKYCQIRPN